MSTPWPPRSAPGPRTRTRAWSCAAPRWSERGTAGSSGSTTTRPRGSACACSSAAPGASPATGGSTRSGAEAAARQGGRLRARRSGRPQPGARAARAGARASSARRSSATRSRSRSPRRSSSACAPSRRSRTTDVKVTVAPRSARSASTRCSSPPTAPRSSRSSSSAAAGSTRWPSRDGVTQIRSYPSAHGGSSAQAGWEYVESLGLEREAPRVGEQAAALLRADPCPAGRDDGRDRRTSRWQLQVHESVGHPTELDRVYGTEAAYAGTSFLKPGRPRLAALRLRAHEHHRRLDHAGRARHLRLRRRGRAGRRASRSSRRASCAASSPRARPRRRSAAARGGSMRADGWSRMPLVRMTNLHLEPGEGSLDELIAGVDDGVYLRDEQELVDRRQAAQLPVRHADRVGDQGRQARPDAARRDLHRASRRSSGARSTRVAGPEEWTLHGLTNCGKGQPGPARARLARRRRPPASATSRSASRRERRARARGAGARARRGRRGARRSCRRERSGHRALRRLARCTSRR